MKKYLFINTVRIIALVLCSLQIVKAQTTTLSNSNILNLAVTNGNESDSTCIRFLPGATSIFDRQFDAYKYYNTGNVPSLYSLWDNTLYSTNSLPVDMKEDFVLPLGFFAQIAGSYTFTLSENAPYTLDYEVYLVDKLLNVTVPLLTEKKYAFTSVKAANEDRFDLHFVPLTITANTLKKSTAISAYAIDNEMVLNASNITKKTNLIIFDVTGKMVKNIDNIDLTNGEYRMSTIGLSGMYVLKAISGSENYSEKLFIKE